MGTAELAVTGMLARKGLVGRVLCFSSVRSPMLLCLVKEAN